MFRNQGIGSWIARRARMAPRSTAVVHRGQRLSYGELEQRITHLARALSERGIERGDRVAFLGTNHPASLEVLFACGLLGAVAVPVHPWLDLTALDHIVEDAEPQAVVVTADLVPTARRLSALRRVPHRFSTDPMAHGFEDYERIVDSGSDEPMDRPVALDDLAVLAFSSGTTGRNKGVMLTHGNLFFNAVNTQSWLAFGRDDILLASAPLYRMGGLGFALAMLFAGGACVIQERPCPERSLGLIEQWRVTAMFDGVGVVDAIARSPAFQTTDLSSLRTCATGGSPVPPELVESFGRRGLCLQTGYGLTEASPLALMVDRDAVSAHPGAAGRPPMYCSVRIVDESLEDVGHGQMGELLVHGPNVMAGYWKNPEATARALVEDGWLRTGDAAFADDESMVTIVGRIADVVILDGRRAHPAPLEARLRRAGVVSDCAVVQSIPGGPLTLFVVAAEGLDEVAVNAACIDAFDALADLQYLDSLPRNANGKLMRAALRETAARRAPPAIQRVG